MKMAIFNLLSVTIPMVTGAVTCYLARNAKGATNLGESLAPWFAVIVAVMASAVAGELAAVVSLVRGERLVWLSWLGVAVNGLLLLPLAYLALTAD